ncbi:MAG: AI-2E family transporter [Candidatus Faecivicinus sp.]
MKQIIPSELKSRTISYIIVVAAGMGMLALLMYFQPIWAMIKEILGVTSPFLVGFALAFLELPILKRVEWFFSKTLFRKKPHPRISRALGVTISLLVVLAVIASFMGIMLPQLIVSIKQLVSLTTKFINDNVEHLNEILVRWDFISFEGEELVIAWENILSEASNYIAILVDNLMAISNTIYSVIFKLFVGLITAFYLLMDKERFCAQAKKICYSLMKQESCETLIYWTRRANGIFAGFISGKILDSLIMGLLCYFGMLLFRMEYPLLISVIVGITNVIPFFGPFIGAIPSVLILLIVNPYSALWFALFILVLQQLDGNVIGPLILGDYVGISPLWIMISIVIGGGLFGFVGMLVSVPVFALIYAIVRTAIETRLKRRGLPVHSSNYSDAPEKFKKNDAN